MRFRSKLEGGEDSSQFKSNPDLVHHPFHRRILACNVTCSLWGQLFRNWTGERGQTPFQPRTPYIYIFQLNPTPLDRQFICIVYKLYIYFVLLSLLYDNNCIIILFYYYLIVHLFLFIIQNYYTIIIFFFHFVNTLMKTLIFDEWNIYKYTRSRFILYLFSCLVLKISR